MVFLTYTMRQLLDKHLESGKDMVMTFIKFRKLCDSIKIENICSSLKVPEYLRNLSQHTVIVQTVLRTKLGR